MDFKLESVTFLCLHCDNLMSMKKALHSPCIAGIVTVAVCDPGVAEVSGCPLRKKKVPITGGL